MSELNPFAVNRAEYMRDLWKYYVPLKELDLETSKALVIEGGRPQYFYAIVGEIN